MEINAVLIYDALTGIEIIIIVMTILHTFEPKKKLNLIPLSCVYYSFWTFIYLGVPSLFDNALRSMIPFELLQTQLSELPFTSGHN